MTKITQQTIIGAVVEEVIAEGNCINCIKLRLPDGRGVDVWAECEEDADHDCRLVYL